MSSSSQSSKVPPAKDEIAGYKAMSDMGHSIRSIASRFDRSPTTIKKYLRHPVLQEPEVQEIVQLSKAHAIDKLEKIWLKAANRLDELLDKPTKVIETTAVMDRSFQQLRLLKDQSTHNIANLHAMIDHQQKTCEELRKKARAIAQKYKIN